MSIIVSFIPGRIRLRHGVLREPQCLDRLAAAVARWRHVHAVTGNARTGSLLVQYDAAALDDGCCAARLAAAVGKLPGANAKENAKAGAGETGAYSRRHGGAPRAQGGGTPRVRANRWAKRGMLLSLAISLALAAAGGKRWHALSGVLFLHALAVHLWAHRRHILR